jgi:hypothetical protein
MELKCLRGWRNRTRVFVTAHKDLGITKGLKSQYRQQKIVGANMTETNGSLEQAKNRAKIQMGARQEPQRGSKKGSVPEL